MARPGPHGDAAGRAGGGAGHRTPLRDALKLSRGQLRGIVESASEGIVTVDASQTIVMANQAAADMFRCRVDELLGAPLERLMPERFRAHHADQLRAFGANRSPPRRMGRLPEVTALRADGEEFPVDAGISQVHSDGTRLFTVILRDLSAARRSAAALHASERMLAATFGVSSVGMAHIDLRTRRFAAVNQALCRMCGYDEHELLTMGPDDLNHPQEQLDPAQMTAVLQGTLSYREEKRLVRKDGTVIWAEISASVVRDDDGRPLRVVAVLHDTTARHQAAEALRASEARQAFLVCLNDRLRVLADPRSIALEACRLLGDQVSAMRVGYAEDDGDGEHVHVIANHLQGVPGIEGRYRYADYGPALVESLRAGRTAVQHDVAADPALTPDERAAHAALQLGASVNVPLLKGTQLQAILFVHASAPRRWAPDELTLFEDVAQRVRADIERARAELQVRAARTTLEVALESMTDSVVIADVQGNFVDFNTAFATFHRFAGKDECLRSLAEYPALFEIRLADGRVAPLEQWAVPRALRGETGINVEYGLRRIDTGARWTGSYSFAPIRDRDGAIVGAVVTGRDISQLKRMHAELQASHAELQRLIDALDRVQEQERLRVAREMHDDLQQGLAAIVIEAAAVRQRLHGSDAAADAALARIGLVGEQVIASTRRIIQDLRPQILEDLGLASALEALASQFSQRAGIPCAVDVADPDLAEPALPAPLAACLYRVAQEALNNVAKHAQAHGVRIALRALRGRRLRLSIADDGVGMPADRRPPASAFGLLGMRERVRAAEGRLRIRSRPGQGSTIEVDLPLPPAHQRAGT
ncbi:MAG: PAS domain S-box protein [Rubrivivax sp.]